MGKGSTKKTRREFLKLGVASAGALLVSGTGCRESDEKPVDDLDASAADTDDGGVDSERNDAGNNPKAMKVTTIVENTKSNPDDNFVVVNGLSMQFEMDGMKVLCDSGPTDALIRNAEILGVDLQDIDLVVISHGHFDHSDGLKHFLETNKKAKVYLHENAVGDYYFDMGGGSPLYIGINKEIFQSHEDRLQYLSGSTQISDKLYAVTGFEKKYPLPGNAFLMKKVGEEFLPDDFAHEVLYVFERADGLVLFSGCSHNGILNVIDACMREFADTPIKAVLGGFHMMNPATGVISETPEYVKKVAEGLLALPIEKTYSGHCTGIEAYEILKESMGDKIEYFPTGTVFDV